MTGDKAKSLLLGFKLAGVKPAAAKSKWTFKASSVACTELTEGSEDGLPSTNCTVDKAKVTGAAASVLMNAMTSAGMQGGNGAGHLSIAATAVTCIDDQTAKGGLDTIYVCTYTP